MDAIIVMEKAKSFSNTEFLYTLDGVQYEGNVVLVFYTPSSKQVYFDVQPDATVAFQCSIKEVKLKFYLGITNISDPNNEHMLILSSFNDHDTFIPENIKHISCALEKVNNLFNNS